MGFENDFTSSGYFSLLEIRIPNQLNSKNDKLFAAAIFDSCIEEDLPSTWPESYWIFSEELMRNPEFDIIRQPSFLRWKIVTDCADFTKARYTYDTIAFSVVQGGLGVKDIYLTGNGVYHYNTKGEGGKYVTEN